MFHHCLLLVQERSRVLWASSTTFSGSGQPGIPGSPSGRFSRYSRYSILGPVKGLLKEDARLVCLIKPLQLQTAPAHIFQCGPPHLNISRIREQRPAGLEAAQG